MERIATFFETEDPATGRLPIVAVIADKVTEIAGPGSWLVSS